MLTPRKSLGQELFSLLDIVPAIVTLQTAFIKLTCLLSLMVLFAYPFRCIRIALDEIFAEEYDVNHALPRQESEVLSVAQKSWREILLAVFGGFKDTKTYICLAILIVHIFFFLTTVKFFHTPEKRFHPFWSLFPAVVPAGAFGLLVYTISTAGACSPAYLLFAEMQYTGHLWFLAVAVNIASRAVYSLRAMWLRSNRSNWLILEDIMGYSEKVDGMLPLRRDDEDGVVRIVANLEHAAVILEGQTWKRMEDMAVDGNPDQGSDEPLSSEETANFSSGLSTTKWAKLQTMAERHGCVLKLLGKGLCYLFSLALMLYSSVWARHSWDGILHFARHPWDVPKGCNGTIVGSPSQLISKVLTCRGVLALFFPISFTLVIGGLLMRVKDHSFRELGLNGFAFFPGITTLGLQYYIISDPKEASFSLPAQVMYIFGLILVPSSLGWVMTQVSSYWEITELQKDGNVIAWSNLEGLLEESKTMESGKVRWRPMGVQLSEHLIYIQGDRDLVVKEETWERIKEIWNSKERKFSVDYEFDPNDLRSREVVMKVEDEFGETVYWLSNKRPVQTETA